MRELYAFITNNPYDKDYCSVTNGFCREPGLVDNKSTWTHQIDGFVYPNKEITFSALIDSGIQFNYYKESKNYFTCLIIREDKI